MNNFFTSLPAVYCIKNSSMTPFISSSACLECTALSAHDALLNYCYDQGYESIMVFENELLLLNNLPDPVSNEISTFMAANTDWDTIILGKNIISDKTLASGYTNIYSMNDTTTFLTGDVYIASRRFMEKIKSNNRSVINTFIYSPAFISNISSAIQPLSSTYTIGHVVELSPVNNVIDYKWKPVKIN